MRCKKHVTDPTSGVGVCASCLRERLFPILAVQSHDESPPSIFLTTPQSSVPNHKRETPPTTSSPFFPSLFRSRLKHAASTSSHPPPWLSRIFLSKKPSAGGRHREVAGGGMSPASDSSGGGPPPLPGRGGRSCSPLPPGRGGGGGRGQGLGVQEVAGFVFCISPLVRAKRPKRRGRSKSLAAVEATAGNPRQEAAPSFCTNRSRKVADFGRERAKW